MPRRIATPKVRIGRSAPYGGIPRRRARAGFGGQQEMLPHRNALTTITQGSPVQRSMGNYAKLTPGVSDYAPSFVKMADGE